MCGSNDRLPGGAAPGGEQALRPEEQSVECDRHQERQASGDDDVRLEGDLLVERAAEGVDVREHHQGGDRHRRDGRDPQAGDDLRQRQGQLDPPEELTVGHPHPSARVLALRRDVAEARQDVPEEDLERVDRQDQDRGRPAQAGDRQQQEDECQRWDRVEDARCPGEGRDQPAAPMRDQSEAERDRKAEGHAQQDQEKLVEERRRVAVEVVDRPTEAKRLVLGLARRVRAGPVVDLDRAEQGHQLGDREGHVSRGRSTAACSSTFASGETRNSEMISTDRTPAIRPCASVTGAYWVSVWRRSASASRMMSSASRIGSGPVSGFWGTVSPRRSESESQPIGRRSESTTRACGTSAPFSLARTSAVACPMKASGASQRLMSLTLIRARRLSARSAPTKSSTKSSAGAIKSSAGVAYWARWPPCFRIAIRSPILIASSMSWVTKSIVLRSSACRRRNSFCR